MLAKNGGPRGAQGCQNGAKMRETTEKKLAQKSVLKKQKIFLNY